MVDTSLYFITAALYLLLGLRDLVSRQPVPVETPPCHPVWRVQGLLLLTLMVHALLLHRVLFASHQMVLSLGNSLSLVGAATVAMYWMASFRCRLGILQSVLMLIVAALVLAPLVLPAEKPVEYSHLLTFKIHLVISLMADGLFGVAALHAVLMSIMEQRLHDHDRPFTPLGALPSLVAMDVLLFQMIWVGFLLLTATLVSGIFFSEDLFDKPLVWNHKVIFSLLSWVIFAGLLMARQLWGIRGRRAARWTLAGFVLLLVGYLGSKFVVEILLHRG
ncbi:cytochrome c biogenesis protein CcsA [Ferrovum sp.]|uniref:cytochrome C assembly family protein n=1 Tax=Ferrovum sp. TaxID=2609467 RepID=UPI002611F9D7|nr:cytochrome c biogenesis protein CcsA [Ferrovum sp.]